MTQTAKTTRYDGSFLNNKDISDNSKKKIDALQEISETLTLNDEYENLVNVHMEAAAEYIQTKLRAKHCVPWETLAVKKGKNVKTVSLCNKRNPTSSKAQKLKKAQRELINAYQKEQIENIQDQINKTRNSPEDRQSWIAWLTANEVNKRKSTSRAKIKATNQDERINTWKDNFKNLLEKSLKVTDKHITKIVNNQVDIKLGHFTQNDLDVVLTKN